MKKKHTFTLCIVLILATLLVSCNVNKELKDGKISLNICLASEPDSLDPALNTTMDGASMLVHLFSGLAKWDKDENGKLKIVADCAEELVEGIENEDESVTYTYKLKDNLKWSDGKALTAKDFEFAWKRAASAALGASYGYMFDVIKGFDSVNSYATEDFAVKALDDRTLQVTTKNYIAYWNELLAFPAYFPVREDVVKNESWATDPKTYVCNGPCKIKNWRHSSVIVLEKNEQYHNSSNITIDILNCYLSDDINNKLVNFVSNQWHFIDDVPSEEIKSIRENYPNEYFVVGQIGTYYIIWNINEDILPNNLSKNDSEAEKAKAEIRQAISLLFDRNYIVEEIVQAGQVPASSFVAMGITNFNGTQFYQSAGKAGNPYYGYYDVSPAAFSSNVQKAIEILKKYYTWDGSKFTNFPALTYLYNTSSMHQQIGEYLQRACASIGITLNLVNQEWNTFLNTRRDGNYSVARNGWIADYNDPACFLDMWISASGNNDAQFGKGNHANLKIYNLDLTDIESYKFKVNNGTWAETYEVLINFIKKETNPAVRTALMHKAEDLLMSTGCIVPLYFYTDEYMLSSKVKGFFTNPLGTKYFMYCTTI